MDNFCSFSYLNFLNSLLHTIVYIIRFFYFKEQMITGSELTYMRTHFVWGILILFVFFLRAESKGQ